MVVGVEAGVANGCGVGFGLRMGAGPGAGVDVRIRECKDDGEAVSMVIGMVPSPDLTCEMARVSVWSVVWVQAQMWTWTSAWVLARATTWGLTMVLAALSAWAPALDKVTRVSAKKQW